MATNISRPTIYAGLREIEREDKPDKKCVRKNGGGCKKITKKYPQILYDLENLVEPF